MKPYKSMYGIACWLFVVPCTASSFCVMRKWKICLADKQHPFLNVFQPEIREERERDTAHIHIGFHISNSDFPDSIRSLSCTAGASVVGERLPRCRTLVK